jgi:MscS family membrane protein
MPDYKKILHKLAVTATLLLLLAIPQHAQAQLLSTLTGTETPKEAAEPAPDSLGRRTPRGTVDGYIQAMADQNYQRASRYLNMKRVWRSKTQRERIVKTFQKLLDQSGEMVPTALISNKPEGRTDDDLSPNKDYVGLVKANGEELPLYVENNEKEGSPAVWQFSQETVDALATISTEDTTLLDILLPQPLLDRKLGGVPVGHWVAVVVLVLFSYLIAWGLVALLGLIIHGVSKKAREERTWNIIKALGLPLRLYLAVLLFVSVSQQVGISIIIRQRFSAITVTIGIVAFLILLWRLSDIVSEYSTNRMTLRKRISAISVILFLRRMAKATIVIIGIIAILGAIGFDVTTWFAALGIGGIALALGAQKTMENFVGSVTLIADQPIRVGDYCKVGDITGTVESIGMRSTRLRTISRTVVTIPNGNFASTSIENYAHRDKFLFNPLLEFRMETTPGQLRYLLVEIRTLFYSHPMVHNDPAKVRFGGLTANGYRVEITAYIDANNIDTAEEIEEDLYLRILDIVEASGTTFAYPSQTLYMARDKGTDADKTTLTEETVKKWKENKEVRLPSFEPEHIEKLQGTIIYPPEDSVVKPDSQ